MRINLVFLGSWTQVAIKRVKCNNDTNESGIVIAIDLLGN